MLDTRGSIALNAPSRHTCRHTNSTPPTLPPLSPPTPTYYYSARAGDNPALGYLYDPTDPSPPLRLAPSTLLSFPTQSIRGLHATTPIPHHSANSRLLTKITPYAGYLMDAADARNLPRSQTTYTKGLSHHEVIDGFHHPQAGYGLAQFCNDPRDPTKTNCTLRPFQGTNTLTLCPTRDIAAGEELFISYQNIYWDHHDPTTAYIPPIWIHRPLTHPPTDTRSGGSPTHRPTLTPRTSLHKRTSRALYTPHSSTFSLPDSLPPRRTKRRHNTPPSNPDPANLRQLLDPTTPWTYAPTSFQTRTTPPGEAGLLSTCHIPNHTTILTLTGTMTTTSPVPTTSPLPTGSCHAHVTQGSCPLDLTCPHIHYYLDPTSSPLYHLLQAIRACPAHPQHPSLPTPNITLTVQHHTISITGYSNNQVDVSVIEKLTGFKFR